MPESFDVVLNFANRQIVDADGENRGKVDDVLLRDDGDQLVLEAVLTGFPAWAARLGGPLGSRLLRAWNVLTDSRPPDVIALKEVEQFNGAIRLRPGTRVRDNHFERWLREHLIRRIPGAQHEG